MNFTQKQIKDEDEFLEEYLLRLFDGNSVLINRFIPEKKIMNEDDITEEYLLKLFGNTESVCMDVFIQPELRDSELKRLNLKGVRYVTLVEK